MFHCKHTLLPPVWLGLDLSKGANGMKKKKDSYTDTHAENTGSVACDCIDEAVQSQKFYYEHEKRGALN